MDNKNKKVPLLKPILISIAIFVFIQGQIHAQVKELLNILPVNEDIVLPTEKQWQQVTANNDELDSEIIKSTHDFERAYFLTYIFSLSYKTLYNQDSSKFLSLTVLKKQSQQGNEMRRYASPYTIKQNLEGDKKKLQEFIGYVTIGMKYEGKWYYHIEPRIYNFKAENPEKAQSYFAFSRLSTIGLFKRDDDFWNYKYFQKIPSVTHPELTYLNLPALLVNSRYPLLSKCKTILHKLHNGPVIQSLKTKDSLTYHDIKIESNIRPILTNFELSRFLIPLKYKNYLGQAFNTFILFDAFSKSTYLVKKSTPIKIQNDYDKSNHFKLSVYRQPVKDFLSSFDSNPIKGSEIIPEIIVNDEFWNEISNSDHLEELFIYVRTDE